MLRGTRIPLCKVLIKNSNDMTKYSPTVVSNVITWCIALYITSWIKVNTAKQKGWKQMARVMDLPLSWYEYEPWQLQVSMTSSWVLQKRRYINKYNRSKFITRFFNSYLPIQSMHPVRYNYDILWYLNWRDNEYVSSESHSNPGINLTFPLLMTKLPTIVQTPTCLGPITTRTCNYRVPWQWHTHSGSIAASIANFTGAWTIWTWFKPIASTITNCHNTLTPLACTKSPATFIANHSQS